jgi:hypothetical protein
MVLFGFLILQDFCFISAVAHWSTSYRKLILASSLEISCVPEFEAQTSDKKIIANKLENGFCLPGF